MKMIKPIFAAMTLLICSQFAAAQASATPQWYQAALNNFKQQQQNLGTQLTTFCANANAAVPWQAWFDAARTASELKAMQLQSFELLQQNYQYLVWPDTKDRVKHQTTAAVQADPQAASTNKQPPSTRSLSAIEWMLTQQDAHQYCPWLLEISQQQQQASIKLVEMQQQLRFGSYEEVLAFWGSVHVANKQIKDVIAGNKVSPYFLPAWRSKQQWALHQSLMANIQLQADYWQSRLQGPAKEELAQHMAKLTTMQAAWPSNMLNQAALTPLTELQAWLLTLDKLIENQLSDEVGIYLSVVGFDGD